MIEPSERIARRWRDADPFMLITTLVIIGFGTITIFNADNRDIGINALVVRQIMYVSFGLALMVTLAAIDYHLLQSLALPIYVGAVALIALVIPFGKAIGGAKRWFDFKVILLQPSEPGKMAVIVGLAAFLAARNARMKNPLNYLWSGALVVIPAVLVFKEPDLGTSLVYLAIWFGMIIVSRTRMSYLLVTIFLMIPATKFAWDRLFHDYQRRRVLIFRDPTSDMTGDGFNIIQARVTIGQAGLVGHRFADTAREDYSLLAVKTTDFAFAHTIGNFGFIGAVALFVLFLLLIWRYLRVAHLARDEFGQFIAIGAAAMLFFQAFVNIGMNVNLLPVTGIPLPFISYGGSPLIPLLGLQGILQSILIHRQKLTF